MRCVRAMASELIRGECLGVGLLCVDQVCSFATPRSVRVTGWCAEDEGALANVTTAAVIAAIDPQQLYAKQRMHAKLAALLADPRSKRSRQEEPPPAQSNHQPATDEHNLREDLQAIAVPSAAEDPPPEATSRKRPATDLADEREALKAPAVGEQPQRADLSRPQPADALATSSSSAPPSAAQARATASAAGSLAGFLDKLSARRQPPFGQAGKLRVHHDNGDDDDDEDDEDYVEGPPDEDEGDDGFDDDDDDDEGEPAEEVPEDDHHGVHDDDNDGARAEDDDGNGVEPAVATSDAAGQGTVAGGRCSRIC